MDDDRGRGADDEATQVAVARALLDAGAVRVQPDEPVTFKSGLRSPVYVDNRRLIFAPAAWRTVVDGARGPRARPLCRRSRSWPAWRARASRTAPRLPMPQACPPCSCARRPRATAWSGASRAATSAGLRTLLVEDMVTTGGSSLSAVAALREAGATVDACLAIITYGFAEARQAFAEASVHLEVLTTFETVVAEARAAGLVDETGAAAVRDWLADPHGWRG